MSFICPVCQAVFTTKGNMIKHIKKYHTEYDVNNIPRKIRNSAVEEPVSVAPIVATEPVVTSAPVVNNEVEILKAQHAHEILILNAQHQANLEIQALRLELEFVKSQNELLKGLLNKALDNSRAPVVSVPAVSEPVVSEPVYSEKKVAEPKTKNNDELYMKIDDERPDAQNYEEFLDYALDDTQGMFVYDRQGNMEPSDVIISGMKLGSSDKTELVKWLTRIVKKFMAPDMTISAFEKVKKKIYVKNDEGLWVEGDSQFKIFIAWVITQMSKSVFNLDKRVNANKKLNEEHRLVENEILNLISMNDCGRDGPIVDKIYKAIIKA